MFPRRTFESVTQQLVAGLQDGTIPLEPPLYYHQEFYGVTKWAFNWIDFVRAGLVGTALDTITLVMPHVFRQLTLYGLKNEQTLIAFMLFWTGILVLNYLFALLLLTRFQGLRVYICGFALFKSIPFTADLPFWICFFLYCAFNKFRYRNALKHYARIAREEGTMESPLREAADKRRKYSRR